MTRFIQRNLIIYANVQNLISEKDKDSVIVVGGAHAAMFYELIKNDLNFNLVEFNEAIR